MIARTVIGLIIGLVLAFLVWGEVLHWAIVTPIVILAFVAMVAIPPLRIALVTGFMMMISYSVVLLLMWSGVGG